MASQSPSLEQLQNDWKHMFQNNLPEAATSKSPSQPKWPVHVDHCFARIILDSVVGIDVPWMQKINSPAYKNMSEQQLRDSIDLGQKIWSGETNLVELNNRSLELRGKGKGMSGKGSGKVGKSDGSPSKRKREEQDDEAVAKRMKKEEESSNSEEKEEDKSPYFKDKKPKKLQEEKEDFTPWLKKIALSDKTSFQKKVLTTLCQVPRGKYTTYGAMAEHLSSAPRAVGNALRNNPFAPDVPCHRVLASGGGLGGFHGSWGRKGEEGLHDGKKRKLLREEGVRFDGKGKVVGAPWTGFI
ncbi:uncharacterized protein LY89DRAFT_679953 [Mollisia scopiformis]|uniref:Methylated-DNA--protein-cysteine methyltransferase n=1 Tax=Mollisia scopiformis TaxID=149040 RepID=A0A194XSH4_MOLSC|nr:uncharacterized protein LY89DRAFT_679953 [Mollisia scopiformis]KUJ23148.1 hypothetical protein LY89DRAFT_679953 [Mollisia scopiformis]